MYDYIKNFAQGIAGSFCLCRNKTSWGHSRNSIYLENYNCTIFFHYHIGTRNITASQCKMCFNCNILYFLYRLTGRLCWRYLKTPMSSVLSLIIKYFSFCKNYFGWYQWNTFLFNFKNTTRKLSS